MFRKFVNSPSLLLTSQRWALLVTNASNPSLQIQRQCSDAVRNKRPIFGIRQKNMKEYPRIKTVKALNFDSFRRSNFKKVKYGDHEFEEDKDGFVHIYTDSYTDEGSDGCGVFAVHYGRDHPLNISGEVMARNVDQVAKTYAILQAIKSVPTDIVKKVCICTPQLLGISFFTCVPRLSENSYRSIRTGRLNKDLEMSMEINSIMRELNHIEWCMKYVPHAIMASGIHSATITAEKKWIEVNRQKKREKYGGFNLLDDTDYL